MICNYLLTFDGLLSMVRSKEYPTAAIQEFMFIFLMELVTTGVDGWEK